MSDVAKKQVVACPHCGRRYQVTQEAEDRRAYCLCRTVLTIPAAKPAPATAVGRAAQGPATATARTASSTQCVHHPDAQAMSACARCHALICGQCDIVQANGSHLCPTCASEAVASVTGGGVLGGVSCQGHPEVAAVARCKICRAPVCQTCVFRFPRGVHLCPTCATNPSRPLSKSRKAFVAWSVGLAGWVTLMLVVLLSGALADTAIEELVAMLLGMAIMIPALVGLALACGSLSQHRGNPPIVWVTVIWNGILMAAWVFLCIIGMMMG